MHVSRPLRRLFLLCGASLLASIGVGLVLALLTGPDPEPVRTGLSGGFAIVGIGWILAAGLSGGFVSTYRAPAQETLYYAVASKGSLVLPADSPATRSDLRNRMSTQPTSMVVLFTIGVSHAALAGLLWLDVLLGVVVLAIVAGLIVVVIVKANAG